MSNYVLLPSFSQHDCATSTVVSSPGDADDYTPFGSYITIDEFFDLVADGALGLDEDCRWVSIDPFGMLVETPIVLPRRADMPLQTIAVAYYAA